MTTKENILNQAIELFAQKGYTETSVKEIAGCAGIQSSSIYNHFQSKGEILDCILNEYLEYASINIYEKNEISRRAQTENPEEIIAGMFFRFGDNKKERYAKILKIILHEQFRNKQIGDFFVSEFIRATEDRLEFLLLELIKNGKLKDINYKYYAKLMNSVTLSMTLEYSHFSKQEDYNSGERITIDELIGFIIKLIVNDDGKSTRTETVELLHRGIDLEE